MEWQLSEKIRRWRWNGTVEIRAARLHVADASCFMPITVADVEEQHRRLASGAMCEVHSRKGIATA